MKNERMHILVYKRLFVGEEDGEMCDIKQTKEQQNGNASGERRDVDDLIFRDETEWLTSDR